MVSRLALHSTPTPSPPGCGGREGRGRQRPLCCCQRPRFPGSTSGSCPGRQPREPAHLAARWRRLRKLHGHTGQLLCGSFQGPNPKLSSSGGRPPSGSRSGSQTHSHTHRKEKAPQPASYLAGRKQVARAVHVLQRLTPNPPQEGLLPGTDKGAASWPCSQLHPQPDSAPSTGWFLQCGSPRATPGHFLACSQGELFFF